MAYDQFHQINATSQMLEVTLRSATTGQLLTGVAFGSVTAKYVREGSNTQVTVSVVTATQGTFTSGGWVETGIAGVYQFGIPDAALAAGAKAVTLVFSASGAIDVVKRVLLVVEDLREVLVSSRLAPATAGRTLAVAATGEAAANVTLWKDQTAPDAPPSKAELDALETHGDATWATADVSALATAAALATVDGIVDAIKLKTDLISADGSVSVTAAISGSTITILRGDSLSVAIAGLGDISTRSKLWFTAKQDTGDADTSAIIQLEETDGLVRLNGAAGTAVLGEITVTDEDAGDITITLDETATDDLTPRRNMSYDVQVLTATGTVTTLTSGTLHVTADVTRAVA